MPQMENNRLVVLTMTPREAEINIRALLARKEFLRVIMQGYPELDSEHTPLDTLIAKVQNAMGLRKPNMEDLTRRLEELVGTGASLDDLGSRMPTVSTERDLMGRTVELRTHEVEGASSSDVDEEAGDG